MKAGLFKRGGGEKRERERERERVLTVGAEKDKGTLSFFLVS